MKYILSTVLLSMLLISSCEKTTETFDASKFGYDYFPLEVGLSWIYQVDSTIFDDKGASIFNSSSFVREVIVEQFQDDLGDDIYRIERFWRDREEDPWKITDVWVATRDETKATRTEENLQFIKMVFPVLEGKRWDGNIFFDENVEVIVSGEPLEMFRGWDDYELLSVDQAEEIGGLEYSKVATVLQVESGEENSLEKRYAIEKYARGVGLIYKENIILDTQNTDVTIPWEERAESGFILKQTLIEFN